MSQPIRLEIITPFVVLAAALAGCPPVIGNDAPFLAARDASVNDVEVATPPPPCADPASVPSTILAARCGMGGCHAASGAQAGLDLVSPGLGARLLGVGAMGPGCAGAPLLAPDGSHGLLLDKLGPTPPCGVRMPEVGAFLDDGAMACVRAWALSLASPDAGTTAHDASTTASDAADVVTTVHTGGTPHGGTTVEIPGRIEAEAFDDDGEGAAYHDHESANLGMRDRLGDGVDIGDASDPDDAGGYSIGWCLAGEWLQYTVHVATAGTFRLDARAQGNADDGGTFHVEVDGADVTGPMQLGTAGGWADLTHDGVALGAGTHVVRVVLDANGGDWVGNFNWFELR